MTTQIKQIAAGDKKKFLILNTIGSGLKQINENLEPTADGKKRYVFEGPCADFNGKNDNDRLYDKDDYVAHLEYLEEDIQQNRLLGEVDHSDNDFDPKMRDIAHIIRKLWYDEEKNQVWIRIEIINNRFGQDIMAAVDQGVPIYISSRASGFIDDAGKVTLERIYTYDIVYRPGFSNAKLERLNESLGIKNESCAFLEWKEKKNTINKDSKNKEMEKFISEEAFNKYTTDLKTKFEGLSKQINEVVATQKGVQIKHGLTDFTKSDKEMIKLFENKKQEIQAKIDELEKIGKSSTGLLEKEVILDQIDVIGKQINETNKFATSINNVIKEQAKKTSLVQREVAKLTAFVYQIQESHNAMVDYIKENVDSKLTIHGNLMKEQSNNLKTISENSTKIAKRVNLIDKDLLNIVTENSKKPKSIKESWRALVDGDNLTGAEEGTTINDSSSDNWIYTLNKDKNVLSIIGIGTNSNPVQLDVNIRPSDEETVISATKDLTDFEDVKSTVNATWDSDVITENKDTKIKEAKKIFKGLNEKQSEACINIFGKVDKIEFEKTSFVKEAKADDVVINEGNYIKVVDDETTYLLKEDGSHIVITNEQFKTATNMSEKKNYTEETNKILENVKKKEDEKSQIVLETKFPFFKSLDEVGKRDFLQLHDVSRMRVAEGIFNGSIDKTNVNEMISNALNENNDLINMLSGIPKRFQKIWESSNKERKEQILTLYRFKGVKVGYETEMFWESLNFDEKEPTLERTLITEDFSANNEIENSLGYSSKYIDAVLS